MMSTFVRLASKVVNSIRLLASKRHRNNVRYSRVVLRRLEQLPHEGAVINYLRKVDPYVVEEVVLSMLEGHGLFVLRNRSYSHDGGIDGRFWWPGRGWHAIQCKRYSSAVRPEHARQFSEVVRRSFAGGVLVHTGRTGDQSQEAMTGPGLFLLSGSTFTRSIKGSDPLELMDRRKSARAHALAAAA